MDGGVVFGLGVAFGAATFEPGMGVDVTFVTGVVTFGMGGAFCVIFGADFDFVENVFFF